MTAQQNLEWWCKKYPKSAPHMRAQAERERVREAREKAAALAAMRKAAAEREVAKQEAWEKALGPAAPAVLAVSYVYELEPDDLLRGTHRGTAEPHCVLAYLLSTRAHLTSVQIGRLVNRQDAAIRQWINRARTHLQWGVKKCSEQMEAD